MGCSLAARRAVVVVRAMHIWRGRQLHGQLAAGWYGTATYSLSQAARESADGRSMQVEEPMR